MNSKQKGKRGELEACKIINQVLGVEARRGVQYQGSPDSPDVITALGIHFEVKRTNKLRLWQALQQSIQDAGESVPVVLHRADRQDWIISLRFEDVLRLVHVLEDGCNGNYDNKNSGKENRGSTSKEGVGEVESDQ